MRVIAITKNCASAVTAGARSGVSLQHGFNLLGGSLIVQMFCCVPNGKNTHCRGLKHTHHHWHLAL